MPGPCNFFITVSGQVDRHLADRGAQAGGDVQEADEILAARLQAVQQQLRRVEEQVAGQLRPQLVQPLRQPRPLQTPLQAGHLRVPAQQPVARRPEVRQPVAEVPVERRQPGLPRPSGRLVQTVTTAFVRRRRLHRHGRRQAAADRLVQLHAGVRPGAGAVDQLAKRLQRRQTAGLQLAVRSLAEAAVCAFVCFSGSGKRV